MSETRYEAAFCARFATAHIPERYKIKSVAESIELTEDVRFSTCGYEYRPIVHLETHEYFRRMAAKNAAKTESLPAQAR